MIKPSSLLSAGRSSVSDRRDIDKWYVLKTDLEEDLNNFDTIRRDGLSTTISSVLNENNANNSFLYQNNYKIFHLPCLKFSYLNLHLNLFF